MVLLIWVGQECLDIPHVLFRQRLAPCRLPTFFSCPYCWETWWSWMFFLANSPVFLQVLGMMKPIWWGGNFIFFLGFLYVSLPDQGFENTMPGTFEPARVLPLNSISQSLLCEELWFRPKDGMTIQTDDISAFYGLSAYLLGFSGAAFLLFPKCLSTGFLSSR